MKLVETPLAGAWVLELERLEDERGHFARTFDAELLVAHGMDARVAQSSTSFNRHAGTLRGMHFQTPPDEETRIARVTRGAVFDVIVDLREGSATRHAWFGVDLSAENGRSLYVPRGFAHGFQTLVDASEVLYVMSAPYVAEAARGVRWDDPAFGIVWPDAPGGRTISARDAEYPDVAA
ncbi:MAG: dTDP-4-dehydrorhamnose 3,5-epimerase family protein [Actinomycetota bacterium]|nr:dTDP-4-dehydrorhamnose 3,5-epimerase family protein [Actinomycetota bacterium]